MNERDERHKELVGDRFKLMKELKDAGCGIKDTSVLLSEWVGSSTGKHELDPLVLLERQIQRMKAWLKAKREGA